MPPNQDEAIYEVTTADSSAIMTPIPQTPDSSEHSLSYSSDSESLIQLDPTSIILYGRIKIPLEENLRELLQKVTGNNNLQDLTSVKLKVIARDICLQHLNVYTPNLSELILDGSVVSSLRDLGCGLTNLKILRVSRCGLSSLDGLFGLQNLKELHASNNSIEDISPCTCLPLIKLINLKKNLLQDISSLSFLSLCSELEHLVLEGNEEIEEFPKYRIVVKRLLPKLKTLDGQAFTEEECSTKIITFEDDNDTGSNCSNGEKSTVVPISLTKEGFLPPISPLNTSSSNRPNSSNNIKVSVASPRDKISLSRPATAKIFSSNDAKVQLPDICNTTDSRKPIVPSLLTSGPPICGNVAAALRHRMKTQEAWAEHNSKK